MASQAIFAHGTLLKIGDGGGPEVFTTVAEAQSIKGPNIKQATIDVTSHSSGGWKEFIGGILEGGQVTFQLNFIPTDATQGNTSGLLRDLKNRTKRNFKLVLTDPGVTTWAFTALVTDFPIDAPTDGKLSASVTLQITGIPTLA